MRRLIDVDDPALGARLLSGVTTNESRPDSQVLEWSARAQEFGRSLARAGRAADDVTVIERTGGLHDGDPVIARYNSRKHTVELFTDSVDFCEHLVDELGWRTLFPTGSIRAAATAHEQAHELVIRDHARELREAVGQTIFRIGRHRRYAYVAGADELAAHAFAQATLGLDRSPLLVTAAAMAALDGPTGNDADTTHKEN
ncbi:hypothetical protein AX769_05850 [Frondihabitans sp. PAMC 28766]|nr:hypothetical protein AX769_05850 [Frondihabitans sp. PAMC 28766]